ncbi:MAG: Fic family protein [Oscillospiraceae bacterium]|jgi:Fic family protein|nr:Fic family protein [Oscillospiraceae bacterium]
MPEPYAPPYAITDEILLSVAEISERIGMLGTHHLPRDNRVKTIHATLAIENNSLTLEQVTAIVNGRRVLGAPGDIQEVKNAFTTYERLLTFDPYSAEDLLHAHALLMEGLVGEAGRFRSGGVGVFAEGRLLHMAPPAAFVPDQVADLLRWAAESPAHPLVKSCVLHYELEFIHPFADGNGRMGRLWQTLLLARWKPLFAWLPVETLIRERQSAYYAALRQADSLAAATPLVEFLLAALRDALREVSTDQDTAQVSAQVKAVLDALGGDTLPASELMARVGLKHRGTFRKNYLQPALAAGFVQMTLPDKPNSRHQKYRRG